jgi:hypothetical protein
MNVQPCRDCSQPVSLDALTCPECGAPRPALSDWHGEGFEWKSTAMLGQWPLVHIAFGIDRTGKLRVARGVIAVGQRAVGGIACGILAVGVVSIGVVCGGAVSLGVVAVGLLLACGVNAIAPLAFGVVAVGAIAGGVNAIAWKVLFSVGR